MIYSYYRVLKGAHLKMPSKTYNMFIACVDRDSVSSSVPSRSHNTASIRRCGGLAAWQGAARCFFSAAKLLRRT